MRILSISDLHFECHADGGKSFVESLPKTLDVLVVAGDLCTFGMLENSLKLLADAAPQVVYVSGNHEFWESKPSDVLKRLERHSSKLSNLHWLERGAAVINGQRFVGATMWFREDPLSIGARSKMNDFQCIKGFVPWVFETNARSTEFLKREVQPGDIVVTHHAPSWQSLSPYYRGSSLNSFYVCDMESTMLYREPKLWFHGHIHNSFDYQVDKTRVICNPFGYVPSMLNRTFDDQLILDVG